MTRPSRADAVAELLALVQGDELARAAGAVAFVRENRPRRLDSGRPLSRDARRRAEWRAEAKADLRLAALERLGLVVRVWLVELPAGEPRRDELGRPLGSCRKPRWTP
jgi:hypothetical protein